MWRINAGLKSPFIFLTLNYQPNHVHEILFVVGITVGARLPRPYHLVEGTMPNYHTVSGAQEFLYNQRFL
jgi:hypothetical protein